MLLAVVEADDHGDAVALLAVQAGIPAQLEGRGVGERDAAIIYAQLGARRG